MSSKVVPALLESTMTVPASAAARAVASSPSGCAARWSVVGAIASGVRTSVPSRVVPTSTSVTSRSTRGRKRKVSQADSASAAETPSRAPCRM